MSSVPPAASAVTSLECAQRYVFADEAGNFDFSRKAGASIYFILTTITSTDCAVGHALLDLRRSLAWDGVDLADEFHAATDKQAVRDRVFAVLSQYDFRIDATILEKPKAVPKLRASHELFYQTAWFLHMKHVTPRIATSSDKLLVVGASLGTKKQWAVFRKAIHDVVRQVSNTPSFKTALWSSASEPCLQAADYCSWAIQRKWESGDDRSYVLIKDKIRTEFPAFEVGRTVYY